MRKIKRRRVHPKRDDDAMGVTVGPNDNIFAVIGLPNPDELLAKAELMRLIRAIIEERGLTQVQAARVLGVSQPDVSGLMNGRIDGFSIERLCRLLKALEHDVRIVVQAKPRSRKEADVRTFFRSTSAKAKS